MSGSDGIALVATPGNAERVAFLFRRYAQISLLLPAAVKAGQRVKGPETLA